MFSAIFGFRKASKEIFSELDRTKAKVPIFPGDTVGEIELRTREQEYNIYPLVIKWFIEDRLILIENQAYLDGKLLPPNGYANE